MWLEEIRGPGRLEKLGVVADLEIESGQVGEIQPVDIVAKCPAPRAAGPYPVSRAAHRYVAVVRTGQDLVDRKAARHEYARRIRRLARDHPARWRR